LEQVAIISTRVIILALFIVLGFIVIKTKYVKKDAVPFVANIISRIMFPMWLAAKLLSPDITIDVLISELPLYIGGISMTLILLGFGFLLAKFLKLPDARKTVFYIAFATANAIFLALPIIEDLYGTPGAIKGTIVSLGADTINWTLGITLLGISGNNVSGQDTKSHMHISPATVTFIACVIFKLTTLSFPKLILDPMEKLGSALPYMGMIFLGMTLSNIKFKEVFTEKLTYIFLPLKIIVIPLVLNIVLKLTGILSDDNINILTIIYSTSPMVSMTPFYAEYGLDSKFGSSVTCACIMFNIVTMPLIFWISTFIKF